MRTSRRRTSLRALSVSLYERPVHPELFNIYREFDFSRGRFDVTVWVTRHCHVLTVKVESTHITELIATDGQPLPAGALLAKFQLLGEKEHTHIFGNRVRYHCDFSVIESGYEDEIKQLHGKLKRRCDENCRLINFPELSTGNGPAFTFIESECSDDFLTMRTKHRRCGRGKLITTKTTIDLSKIAN